MRRKEQEQREGSEGEGKEDDSLYLGAGIARPHKEQRAKGSQHREEQSDQKEQAVVSRGDQIDEDIGDKGDSGQEEEPGGEEFVALDVVPCEQRRHGRIFVECTHKRQRAQGGKDARSQQQDPAAHELGIGEDRVVVAEEHVELVPNNSRARDDHADRGDRKPPASRNVACM